MLLYGYGAYGISIPASFATARLSLVDRGFIYAIAHIRGGKDKGYRWYTNGKMKSKTNTFKDFIAAGEFLVAQGLTKKGRLVGNGGSTLFVGTPRELADLARGRVWLADDRATGAHLSWRTGEGRHRHVGDAPAGADLAEPTLEDGYLLLLGERPLEEAA